MTPRIDCLLVSGFIHGVELHVDGQIRAPLRLQVLCTTQVRGRVRERKRKLREVSPARETSLIEQAARNLNIKAQTVSRILLEAGHAVRNDRGGWGEDPSRRDR